MDHPFPAARCDRPPTPDGKRRVGAERAQGPKWPAARGQIASRTVRKNPVLVPEAEAAYRALELVCLAFARLQPIPHTPIGVTNRKGVLDRAVLAEIGCGSVQVLENCAGHYRIRSRRWRRACAARRRRSGTRRIVGFLEVPVQLHWEECHLEGLRQHASHFYWAVASLMIEAYRLLGLPDYRPPALPEVLYFRVRAVR